MTYSLTCFLSDDNLIELFKTVLKQSSGKARSHSVSFGVVVVVVVYAGFLPVDCSCGYGT